MLLSAFRTPSCRSEKKNKKCFVIVNSRKNCSLIGFLSHHRASEGFNVARACHQACRGLQRGTFSAGKHGGDTARASVRPNSVPKPRNRKPPETERIGKRVIAAWRTPPWLPSGWGCRGRRLSRV